MMLVKGLGGNNWGEGEHISCKCFLIYRWRTDSSGSYSVFLDFHEVWKDSSWEQKLPLPVECAAMQKAVFWLRQ